MISHASCGHPATRSARAACRRDRARHQSRVTTQAPVETPKSNRKRMRATNGQLCTPAELRALRNVAEKDCPAIKSNDVCRSIRTKGFAYWNRVHWIWMLTEAGQDLVRRSYEKEKAQ